jgi:ubiquinone/menaquinone biosynthesis C-methylase UbiE
LHAHRRLNDEKERRKWQNPEAILADLGLEPGSTFIDVGCGDGFFTVPATRLVGRKGRVCGLDISDEAIGRLRARAAREGLDNLTLRTGAAEQTVFCATCADIVFFGIVLHDFADAAKVLLNAKKMLKPNGRLVDLDWKKKLMRIGPPLQIGFSQRRASSLIQTAGFKIKTVKQAGPYHYMIVATPL